MQRATWWTLLLLAMAAPALAQDGSGFARSAANLRAGPANDYPRVATVVGGDSLTVYGCVQDVSWCDVRWRAARGWLPGGVIEFAARDGGVPPVVAFAVDPYWDAHYRGKPWASARARWRQTPQAAPSAAAPMPEALKRQLIPSRIADAMAQPSEPPASAPAQWVPPGERMYQVPPPDALNPKRNKELAEQRRREEDERRWRESGHDPSESPPSASFASPQQQRKDEDRRWRESVQNTTGSTSSSSSSWWAPAPEDVALSVKHTPPPPQNAAPSPPHPAPAQSAAPSTPQPKKDQVRDKDSPRRRDGKQQEP